MNRKSVLLMLVLLLQAGSAFAEAPTYDTRELFEQANGVYVARVDSVGPNWPYFWQRVATATVLEVWKGEKRKSVEFRASPSWTCDTSHAITGELVLLMLEPDSDGGLAIANSGQGRFPVSGGLVDALFTPKIASAASGPRAEWTKVPLAELRRLLTGPARPAR